MVQASFYLDGQSPVFPDFGTVARKDFTEKKRVSIASLIPNQLEVDQELVTRKRKGKGLSDIYVINYKGKNYIIDGHHTVIAKKLNGQKYVFAYYIKQPSITI